MYFFGTKPHPLRRSLMIGTRCQKRRYKMQAISIAKMTFRHSGSVRFTQGKKLNEKSN